MGHVQKIATLIFVLAVWAASSRADNRDADQQQSVSSPRQSNTADQRAQTTGQKEQSSQDSSSVARTKGAEQKNAACFNAGCAWPTKYKPLSRIGFRPWPLPPGD